MLATLCKPRESVTTPSICDSDILYGLNPTGNSCIHTRPAEHLMSTPSGADVAN